MVPSGASAIAIGPMAAWLCSMPVAKACARKGARTVSNSLGRSEARVFGMPASAWEKSGLVEGSGAGSGARPKFGGVVPDTVGRPPRLTLESSAVALMPGFGVSRLPATSVASARNS